MLIMYRTSFPAERLIMTRTKKTILIAIMTSIGVVLQIFESQIPIPINLPGGKIGLANIVGLILIPTLGGTYAMITAIARAIIGSMYFGGMIGAVYSVFGAILSTLAMIFSYKFLFPKATLIGIGVLGAVFHNTAQVTTAAIILSNVGIFVYLPVLIIISVFSGSFTGLAARLILKGRMKWLEDQTTVVR